MGVVAVLMMMRTMIHWVLLLSASPLFRAKGCRWGAVAGGFMLAGSIGCCSQETTVAALHYGLRAIVAHEGASPRPIGWLLSSNHGGLRIHVIRSC